MKVIKEKHSLAMRWCHWVNFPILTIMIWSGMLIYWANDVYSITIFGHTFVRFFPDWFYRTLGIPQRLAEGMAFHFLFMWFFTLNGILYVAYTIFQANGASWCLKRIRLRRPGWCCFMICISAKLRRLKTNTMQRSASLIHLLL